MRALRVLRDTLGWLGYWLISMLWERRWRSLDSFLSSHGWINTGRILQ